MSSLLYFIAQCSLCTVLRNLELQQTRTPSVASDPSLHSVSLSLFKLKCTLRAPEATCIRKQALVTQRPCLTIQPPFCAELECVSSWGPWEQAGWFMFTSNWRKRTKRSNVMGKDRGGGGGEREVGYSCFVSGGPTVQILYRTSVSWVLSRFSESVKKNGEFCLGQ
jgi:hypothetical protein